MNDIAVVTGAGTGVGRAVAHLLARAQWRVAVAGRNPANLEETMAGSGARDQFLVVTCDIGDAAAVGQLAQKVEQTWGTASVLVNAAGTNTPRRSLAQIS